MRWASPRVGGSAAPCRSLQWWVVGTGSRVESGPWILDPGHAKQNSKISGILEEFHRELPASRLDAQRQTSLLRRPGSGDHLRIPGLALVEHVGNGKKDGVKQDFYIARAQV